MNWSSGADDATNTAHELPVEKEIYVKTLTRTFGYRCSVARPEFGSSTFDLACRHWRDDGTRILLNRAYRDLAFGKFCLSRRN